jgi:hypothetical protein
MKYQDFPSELMQEQPLDLVLKNLGFASADLGVVRNYDGIEFGVCESIDCSFLSRDGRVTSRTWTPSFTGFGKRPVRTPSHQQDFFMGMIAGVAGLAVVGRRA